MKKLKFSQIEAIRSILNNLYECNDLESNLKLIILRLIREVKTEYDIFLSLKTKLIEKYVLKDNDGKVKTFINSETNQLMYDMGENADKYIEEIQDLLNQNTNILIEKFKISLESLSKTNLTVKDIDILIEMKFVDDEKEIIDNGKN